MAKSNEAPANVTDEPIAEQNHELVKTEPDLASTDEQGRVVRRAFMLKQFLPNKDWINTNVVAKGQGHKVSVGRIFGIVTKTERKTNTMTDGSTSESIVCIGAFESTSYLNGEIAGAVQVYLPMAYAEQIEMVLKQAENLTVEIDCDIALEATGKTIPYAWNVTAFNEGNEMDVLKKMRRSRPRPATAPALPEPEAKKVLTDQSA